MRSDGHSSQNPDPPPEFDTPGMLPSGAAVIGARCRNSQARMRSQAGVGMWYAWLEAQHKLLQMLGGWPVRSDDASRLTQFPGALPAAGSSGWLSTTFGTAPEPPP